MFDNLSNNQNQGASNNSSTSRPGAFDPTGFGPAPVSPSGPAQTALPPRPVSAQPASPSPVVPQTEDMFSGMDPAPQRPSPMPGTSFGSDKPPVFQPKAPSMPALPHPENFNAQNKFKQYSAIALGSVLVILLLVSGVWVFGKMFRSAPSNSSVPVNNGLSGIPVDKPADQIAPNQPAAQPSDNQSEKVTRPTTNTESTNVLDTDQDGLTDQEEEKYGTAKNFPDSDHDGLSDRDEIKVFHTDPLIPDTDGDGYKDGDEVKNGFNPLGQGKLSNLGSVKQ